MMTKLTIRNLTANKGRFAMTTFGVLLAVSFVVSALVMSDGLRRTFGDLGGEIVAGTDVGVRPVDDFGNSTTLSDADLAAIAAVDGVNVAAGQVEAPQNSVRPLNANGDELPSQGPPQLAFNWVDVPELSPTTMVQGRAPNPGEFVMDLDSGDRHGFVIGETYSVVTSTGRHELFLSGYTRFGADNTTLGAVLMHMHNSETDMLFGTNGYDSVAVSLTEAARSDVPAAMVALAAAVPGTEAVNNSTLEVEEVSEFTPQIDVIRNILLGFGGVAMLVSIFIIYNTFAIVLSQRTREIGLLRLVGADTGDLRRSSMGEALVIGILASALGIGGGLAVAGGLGALFEALGFGLPDYPKVISRTTMAAAAFVGIGVTLVAAYGPTRAASKMAPIAALRDGSDTDTGRGGRRLLSGAVLLLIGLGFTAFALASSLTTSTTVTLLAVAAIAIVLGVTLVSPALVAPVTGVAAAVLGRLGVSGAMAASNARRQPKRTATTAAALMIGLAVVSMALIVGESVKADLRTTLDSQVKADYLVTDQVADAGFPDALAETVAANPALGSVTSVQYADARIDDDATVVEVTAANLSAMPDLFDMGISEGGYGNGGGILLSESEAESRELSVGDVIAVTLESGVTNDLPVAGVYENGDLIQADLLVDTSIFEAAGVDPADKLVAFNAADGATNAQVTAAVAQVETMFPTGELETATEYRERLEGLIDQILVVLNALVALAVIIALVGIANTLALSINERTREIGLVRAVGMSRKQLRRMVRYESAIIAGFGSLLGIAVGIGFGWVAVQALPSSFVDTVAIPVGAIVTMMVIAIVAGLLAALLPARRAGRMNVLTAIAS